MKHLRRIGLAAWIVAWGFDFLFWEKTPGVSFAIYTAICLAGGFFLTWSEDKRPARASLLLLIPIGFFAVMSFWRIEPLSQALDYLLTLGTLALFVMSYTGGQWLRYGWRDYLLQGAALFFSAIARPLMVLSTPRSTTETQPAAEPAADAPSTPKPAARRKIGQRVIPVVRGVILALPVLIFFGVLLASADPIFSSRLNNVFTLFQIENLPEYLFRLIYITILAFILAGVYLHALTASSDANLLASDQPWPPPFLGLTEAGIVLGSVNLLFGFFVLIQFQYFFGGQANIAAEGYTYADYARRGFGELAAVALFSLLLFLSLSSITRRSGARQQRLFSGLGALLTLLVLIILASAFQRLLLYEQAYGFTRLRTYPHIFMIWLGLLLLGLLGMELSNRLRYFPLAALIAALGFGATLNIINVDALIVRQNAQAAQAGAELDVAYLNGLSADAIPAMVEIFNHAQLAPALHDDFGGVLACQKAMDAAERRDPSWQAFHLARWNAAQWLQAADLNAYPVRQGEYGQWSVQVNGEERSCAASRLDY